MEKIVKGMSTYLENVEGFNLDDREVTFLMLSVPPICNYSCKKCFNSVKTRYVKDLLTLEEYFRLIKEAKNIGAKSVTILGEGEPLVYNNIKNIIEYVYKLGLFLTIATNGRMLSKDIVDFLFRHDVIVGIGLDTLDQKEYDSYCGGNANLKEVINNIDYIRKLYSHKIYEVDGYKIYQLVVHTTVTPKNINQIQKIEEYCGDDIYHDCQPLSWVGDANKNASFFKNCKSEYNEFQITKNLLKPPMVLTKIRNGKNICCLFYYGIFIGCNGDVVLDASITESLKYIGNIRDHPLQYLVKKRNKLRDYYINNYNLLGYCPIREQKTMEKFKRDLKESKYES